MKLIYQMNKRGPGKIHADDGTGKPMCKKGIVNGWNGRITETSEGEPNCKACAKLAAEPDYKTLKRWHSEALEVVYKQQRLIEELERQLVERDDVVKGWMSKANHYKTNQVQLVEELKQESHDANTMNISEDDKMFLLMASQGRGVITFSRHNPDSKLGKQFVDDLALAAMGLVADDYFDSSATGRPMVSFTITEEGRKLLEKLS